MALTGGASDLKPTPPWYFFGLQTDDRGHTTFDKTRWRFDRIPSIAPIASIVVSGPVAA